MDICVKQNSKFKLFLQEFKNFIYSGAYVAIVALCATFSYVSGLNYSFLLLFVLTGSLILVSQRDLTPLFPLLFFISFIFSSTAIFDNYFSLFLFLPAVVSLIIHFIKFPIKKFKVGKLLIPLVLILVSYLLGGVASGNYLTFFQTAPKELMGKYLAIVLALGVGILAEYLVLSQYVDLATTPKTFCIKKYLSYILVCLGLAIGVMVAYEKFIVQTTSVYMGWGNVNLAGYVLLLALPCAWFLMIKSQKVIPSIFLIALLLVSVYITNSDGALGVSIMMSLPLAVYTYTKLSPKKKGLFLNVILPLLLAICLVIIAIIIFDYDLFIYLQNKLLSDTGRLEIYEQAILDFKKKPLFGLGVFYPIVNQPLNQFNYHSSILHTLATTGILGLCCWLYYFIARLKITTKRNTPFNFCAMVSFVSYQIYALIDTGEFVMTCILVIGLLLIVEKANEKESELPLLSNANNGVIYK